MNTYELQEALRNKYTPPAYALLWEVGNGTGGHCSRHADAIAMSLWPSRGLELIGFELKTSRTDWQKELSDPEKADSVARYCDRWYVVAGAADIVRTGELPPTWGLMVPHGIGLKIATEAPRLEAIPIDRVFLAALLRRASEQSVDAKTIKAANEAGYKRGYESANESNECDAKYRKEELDTLVAKVRAFEEASGLNISGGWETGWSTKMGEAVKIVMRGEHKANEEGLRRIRGIAQSIVEKIDASGVIQDVSAAAGGEG